MKKQLIDDNEADGFFQDVRKVVSLQIRLWDECLAIDEFLQHQIDGLALVLKFVELRSSLNRGDLNLGMMLNAGRGAEPPDFRSVETAILRRHGVTFEGEAWLLGRFRRAVEIARVIEDVTVTLVDVLKLPRRFVNEYIWALAITAASGMELSERDIRHAFVGGTRRFC